MTSQTAHQKMVAFRVHHQRCQHTPLEIPFSLRPTLWQIRNLKVKITLFHETNIQQANTIALGMLIQTTCALAKLIKILPIYPFCIS